MVALEVPLLTGLQYHITVYHPYRPLKSLLTDMITAAATAAGAGAGAADGEMPAPTDPAFIAVWDALQGRAIAVVDASLTTDACLLYSPAHIAAAALLVAARVQPDDTTLALPKAPPIAVRLRVHAYIEARFAGGGAGMLVVQHLADNVLEGTLRDGAADPTLALPLNARLAAASANPTFQRGTPAHDARLLERAREREAYKASKGEARRAAQELASSGSGSAAGGGAGGGGH